MLDRENSMPLWKQLEDILREQILSEKWPPNGAIPSENALSEEYGISRMTARSVITRLALEGLLYRVPGKGTFVSQAKITATPLPYSGIREQLELQGYETSTVVIRNEPISPPVHVIKKFALRAGDGIYLIERLRFLKGEHFSYHRTYLRHKGKNMEAISADKLEKEQLCKILERDYGIVPDKVIETLEMVYSTKELSQIFKVEARYPLLCLHDYLYCGSELVESSEVYFKGDRIKLSFEFNK
jgi:GntR family transcriptional regulator